jgi:hypothetical protein
MVKQIERNRKEEMPNQKADPLDFSQPSCFSNSKKQSHQLTISTYFQPLMNSSIPYLQYFTNNFNGKLKYRVLVLTAGRRKPQVNDNDDNILQLILVNCKDPKSSFFLPICWASLLEIFNQASDSPKIVSPLPSELINERNEVYEHPF